MRPDQPSFITLAQIADRWCVSVKTVRRLIPMNNIDPDFLARSRSAFISEAPLTMADVKRSAEADAELTDTQRRDLVSAINRIQ